MPSLLRTHGRFPYSAINVRPRYAWPGGKRLAVYLGLNLEHFAFGEGHGGELAPSGRPDVLNYSWREYGNRVGAWRLLDEFEELRLPVSVLANSEIAGHCPELLAAHIARGDEVVGHGRTNAERQGDLVERDEAALIAETTSTLADAAGATRSWQLAETTGDCAREADTLATLSYSQLLSADRG